MGGYRAVALDSRGPEIERYLSVAATLHSDVRFGGAINAKQLAMIEQLSHPSDATRAAALEGLEALEPDDQSVIISGLSEQLTRMNDPEHAIDSLAAIAARMPAHADAVGRALRHPAVVSILQVHHEPYLKSMRDVLQQIVERQGWMPTWCEVRLALTLRTWRGSGYLRRVRWKRLQLWDAVHDSYSDAANASEPRTVSGADRELRQQLPDGAGQDSRADLAPGRVPAAVATTD